METAEKSAQELEELKRLRKVEKLLHNDDQRRMMRALQRPQTAPVSGFQQRGGLGKASQDKSLKSERLA